MQSGEENMNFSAITVSFPIDEETYEEIRALSEAATETDVVHYNNILNLPIAKSYDAQGFYVLVYDDQKDALAGVASAVDLMGLNTYEWSLVVAPMYRQLGIGEALFQVLHDGLEARGAQGELALAIEGAPYSQQFLKQHGFQYSFSEATLEAEAELTELRQGMEIRSFNVADTAALAEIFSAAFGDLPEESLELIDFNTNTPGLKLWVALENNEIVGTVTTRKEGELQWITAFAVHPNFAGRGIGTEILHWVKRYTLCNGEKIVTLDVEIDNNRALAVYEKAGFLKATQVDYYIHVG